MAQLDNAASLDNLRPLFDHDDAQHSHPFDGDARMVNHRSRWQIRPPTRCLAVTLLIPVLWVAVVRGLESAGQEDLALGVGWLTIPLVFLTVPFGLLVSLVLALRGRNDE